jgi:hypothetical protein
MTAGEWAILVPAIVALLGAVTAHLRINKSNKS